MGETWRGFNMDFAASLLSFWMPTYTHDFDNHHIGYGCSKIALKRS
jgi:hypothetical protein